MEKSNLLSLQFYSSPKELSSFLVVEAEEIRPENLDLFTPTFMKWGEKLWVFDLKSCRKYWIEQAQRQNRPLHDLLQEQLKEHFVASPSYRAVLTPHPWPALLLIRLMQKRNLAGLLLWEASYTQALYKSLGWSQWFDEVRSLAELTPGKANGEKAKFKSQINAMGRAMDRLSLKSPWDLRAMPAASLQRRYGALLARAWSWTFPETPEKTEQMSLFDFGATYPYDLRHFPWTSYSLPEPPQSHRLLEYPVSDWECIKTFLLEDLDKLLKHRNFSRAYQVCELEWRITLCNFKELLVPVSFHSPHHLYEEEGEHKTSLNQLYYAYERAMKTLKVRDEDLDLPLQIPFASWELKVSQKFALPSQSQSFISSAGELNGRLSQLRDFSNKLPAPVICYSLHPDFCPERSFGQQRARPEDEELLESWRFAAKKRPLFILKKARHLARTAMAGPKFFLERSSESWWEKGESSSFFRDYFLVQDKDLKWLWAYRNTEGQWFQHGLYS